MQEAKQLAWLLVLKVASGAAIKINSGSYTQGLYTGNNNDLRFQAYVRAEPVALQNKSPARFMAASATFKLGL